MKKWKKPGDMQPIVEVLQSLDPDDPLKDKSKTICPCTDAVRSIPAEDSQIFESGTVFKAEIRFVLANQAIKYLVFETPAATEEIPLYVIWGTDIVKSDVNNVEYELYEDAVWTGVAVQPVINQNRVFATMAAPVTPQTLLFNTTIADPNLAGATEIDLDTILGSIGGPGVGVPSAGGAAPGTRFLILKPGTKHALKIKNNNGTDAANVTVKSSFLEGLFPGIYAKANP